MSARRKIFTIVVGISLMVLALSACTPQAEPAATETVPQGGDIGETEGLIEALEEAGATVEVGDEIEHEFFPVPARVLEVNGAQVQVFEFPDEAAREAAQETISPDGSSIGTSMITWVEPPHFFVSGRLIVLYLGSDEEILDLLTGILGEPFAG